MIDRLKDYREQYGKLQTRALAAIYKAEQENRELTEAEQKVVDEATNTPLKEKIRAAERAQDVVAEAGREKLAPVLAKLTGTRFSDAPNVMHSHNGNSSAQVFAKGESMAAAHAEVLKEYPPNALGELIVAKVCGPSQRTDLSIRQALKTTDNTLGGFMVPDYLDSEVIDLARAKAVVLQAGARVVRMEGGSHTFARVTGDPTVSGSKAEMAAFSLSDISFGSVVMQAHTIGVAVEASRELLEDATNAASLIQSVLATALAQRVDYYALRGSGSAQPLGLIGHPNIASTAAGAGLNWNKLSDGALEVRKRNHTPNAAIMSPKSWSILNAFLIGDGTNSPLGWLGEPRTLTNVGLLDTTSLADSTIIMGDFSKFFWGVRSGLTIEVSTVAEGAFLKHAAVVKAVWRGDFALADATAFQNLTGL